MIRLKNSDEIEGIRKSCHLLADMFKAVIPEVKPGVTTKRIDDLCKDFMLAHGGTPAWYHEDFPGAACISINDEVIHGVPSKKRIIRDGDLVSLDVGIDLNGYISDSSHTILVGNVKPEWRKLDEVTLECAGSVRVRDNSECSGLHALQVRLRARNNHKPRRNCALPRYCKPHWKYR